MLNNDELNSHYIFFHWARIKYTTSDIILSITILNRVKYAKCIGMKIEGKLNFTQHIFYDEKYSKGMGIMIKTRKYRRKKF